MDTKVKLPQTELVVSRVCLGTGGVGSSIPADQAPGLFDRFVQMGGTFIDTAHNYGDWVEGGPRSASEKTFGAWLRSTGLRKSLVLATKGGHPKFDTPDVGRLSANDIAKDLDGSLEALGVETVDLYWLHADEKTRPVEEIMDSLFQQRQAGKFRYMGASNWQTSRIREANQYAASVGQQGFVADQILWNAAPLATKPYGSDTTGWMNAERFSYHMQTGMACVPYQSQAFGLFHRMAAGTLEQMNKGFRGFYVADESAARFQRMQTAMKETGLSVTQVVLGYLMAQPFVTVPIVGCQKVAQVEDSLSALDTHLDPKWVDFIDGGVHGSEIP